METTVIVFHVIKCTYKYIV